MNRISHLLLGFVFSFLLFTEQSCNFLNNKDKSITDETPFDTNGYNYAIQRLKAPSTAVLNGFVEKTKVRDEAKQRGWTMPAGLEAEIYIIEGTNLYGGRLEKAFTVFFWNGQPIECIEKEPEESLSIFRNPTLFYIKESLKRKGVVMSVNNTAESQKSKYSKIDNVDISEVNTETAKVVDEQTSNGKVISIQMKDDADFCEFKYDSNGNMKEIYSEEAGHGLELKTTDFHGKNQLLIDNDDIIEDDNTKTKIRINNGRVSTAENVASIPSWVSPVYYNWNNEGDLASIAHGNSDEKVVNVEYDKTKQNLLNVDFTLFVMSRHLMSTAFPIVLFDGNVSKPSKHLPIKITVDDLGTMHGGQTIYKLQWIFDSQNRPTSVSVKKKSDSETQNYTYTFKYK